MTDLLKCTVTGYFPDLRFLPLYDPAALMEAYPEDGIVLICGWFWFR